MNVQIIEWYESQTDAERQRLQIKFGKYDIADRETKFFDWLEKKIKL